MNKMLKKISLFITILLTFTLMTVNVFAYVNIVEQSDDYYVTDAADIISKDTTEYIINKNKLLNEVSGVEIFVVTVDFLNADITDYAYTIFNEYKIGDSDLNNGILLLLSVGDDDYFCMIGSGLESQFQIDELSDILDEYLEPSFAERKYDEGVKKVFDALYNKCVYIFNVDENNIGNSPSENIDWFFIDVLKFIIIAFIVITFIVLIMTISLRNRYSRPYNRRRYYTRTYFPYGGYYNKHNSAPKNNSSSSSWGNSSGGSIGSWGSSSKGSSGSWGRSSSKSFSPRSGGSSRGAGAGRRK